MDKHQADRGAKNRLGWPLDLDTRDPEQVASFTLGLGYDEENVVNTVARRCNLDRVTAREIVRDAISTIKGRST